MLVVGHGPTEWLDTWPRWVLVVAGPDGGHRRLGHHGWPVGVGEPLSEVDGPGVGGQGGHLGEDGDAKLLEPFDQVRVACSHGRPTYRAGDVR